MSSEAELCALFAAAEARRDAGERPLRHIPLAYSVPAGDGNHGLFPWLSEAEADRVHQLKQEVDTDGPEQARERLRLKFAARRKGQQVLNF